MAQIEIRGFSELHTIPGEGGTDQLHSSADLLPTKGGFPTSRNFYVRTHVNKINAIMVG